jgi:hypothetical protein
MAKNWYAALTKSSNKTLAAEAQKAIDTIAVNEKQFATVTTLPQELSRPTTIKALPVPYTINKTLVVKASGTLTIEKGACIRGGRLLLENSTMTMRGTKDSPIVFEDVEIGTSADNAKLSVTGEYVLFVRSPLMHFDNAYYMGQHKWSLKNCVFLGPAEQVFYDTYGYEFVNCSFTNYKLKICKDILKPVDFISGPASLVISRCDIDPRMLWSTDKTNYYSCSLMTDEKYTLKFRKVCTQRTVWFDKSSQGLLNWKAYIVPDAAAQGRAELFPMPDKNPVCGPDWTSLSFTKPD